MEKEKVLSILKETGGLLEGHFLLTSGRHSDKYMQCAKLFEHPNHSEEIAKDIAAAFAEDKVDVVVGPAMGGIILAYEVARQLGVSNAFAERENGKMALRRFEIKPGQRVLVVEDVVTTGGSGVEVIGLLRSLGAEVVGVGLVVDRSNGKVDFGCKKHAVLTTEVVSWPAEECPICDSDVPLVKPGSRKI